MEMEPLVKLLGTSIVPQKVYARYFTCPEEVETTYIWEKDKTTWGKGFTGILFEQSDFLQALWITDISVTL